MSGTNICVNLKRFAQHENLFVQHFFLFIVLDCFVVRFVTEKNFGSLSRLYITFYCKISIRKQQKMQSLNLIADDP